MNLRAGGSIVESESGKRKWISGKVAETQNLKTARKVVNGRLDKKGPKRRQKTKSGSMSLVVSDGVFNSSAAAVAAV